MHVVACNRRLYHGGAPILQKVISGCKHKAFWMNLNCGPDVAAGGATSRTRSPAGAAAVATAAVLAGLHPCPVNAQLFEQYLSPSVLGIDNDRSAIIAARPQTEYDPLGIRLGDVVIRPQLDESIGFNSNVLGTRPSVGSAFVNTSPTVTITPNLGRDALGATFGLSDQRYLAQKQQSNTNWNASVGGSLDIGRDRLSLGISEIYQHLLPTGLDSNSVTTPIGFKVTDIQARYNTAFARFQIEPNAEYIGYRYDDTVLPGSNFSQKVHDRDVYVGGLTARYGEGLDRNLVLVTRVIDSMYIADLGGQVRPNSIGYEVLGGVNYSFSGKLQAVALGGYEVRQFSKGVFPTRSSPVGQLSVLWAPTGLTTISARGSISIEDSLGESSTGVTLSRALLTVDHEYQRNLLLQGRASASNAEYGQGIGHQNLFGLGASASYLFNRNLRLTTAYDFSVQTGTAGNFSALPFAVATNNHFGNYALHVATVMLRFAL